MPTCEVSHASPVCLGNGNSNWLVSLYEMLRISAYAFVSIGSTIEHLQMILGLSPDQSATVADLEEYTRLLDHVEAGCKAMGTVCTERIVVPFARSRNTLTLFRMKRFDSGSKR